MNPFADAPESSKKKLGSGPRTRVCYICGRQYGLHSFEIHLKQCKELWIAREALKDPKDRKPLPCDPMVSLTASSPLSNESDAAGRSTPSSAELAKLNQIASDAFNTTSLVACLHCGRTFLQEKLIIHNRSCTADNPARRVTDAVRRGNTSCYGQGASRMDDMGIPEAPSTSLKIRAPSPSLRVPRRGKFITSVADDVAATAVGRDEIMVPRCDVYDSITKEDGVSAKLLSMATPPRLAGPIGGSAGRLIRNVHEVNGTVSAVSPELLELRAEVQSEDSNQTYIVKACIAKMETVERIAGTLMAAVDDLRATMDLLLDGNPVAKLNGASAPGDD